MIVFLVLEKIALKLQQWEIRVLIISFLIYFIFFRIKVLQTRNYNTYMYIFYNKKNAQLNNFHIHMVVLCFIGGAK